MVEVLGVVSGVAGLLSLTITILDGSLAYYASAKDASKSMSQLLKELISLKSVLSSIQDNIVTNPNISSAFKTTPSSSVVSNLTLELVEYNFGKSTPGILEECSQCLNSILQKIQKGLRGDRGPTILKRLTWPFTEKEVLKEVGKLQRYRDILKTSLTMDILTLGVSTNREVKTIRQEQREWHAKISEAKILEWLSPLSFRNKHLDVAAKRQAGTADWVLESDSFSQWMKGDVPSCNILWGPGDPGVGKTIIAYVAQSHLLARS